MQKKATSVQFIMYVLYFNMNYVGVTNMNSSC